MGRLFMTSETHPFLVAERLVDELRGHTPVVIVDFHAEATSEKIALARLLDGRATAVVGTHTHVQTNDARVLAGGTAALTDAGMTGPHDSVIGVRAELAIERMRHRHAGSLPSGGSRRPDRGRAGRVRRRTGGLPAARRCGCPCHSGDGDRGERDEDDVPRDEEPHRPRLAATRSQ